MPPCSVDGRVGRTAACSSSGHPLTHRHHLQPLLRVHALVAAAVGAAQLAAGAAVGVVSLARLGADPERVRLRLRALAFGKDNRGEAGFEGAAGGPLTAARAAVTLVHEEGAGQAGGVFALEFDDSLVAEDPPVGALGEGTPRPAGPGLLADLAREAALAGEAVQPAVDAAEVVVALVDVGRAVRAAGLCGLLGETGLEGAGGASAVRAGAAVAVVHEPGPGNAFFLLQLEHDFLVKAEHPDLVA